MNKAHRIGNRHATTTGQAIRTRRGIERGKEFILRKDRRARKAIEERRLAGIGVSSQGNAKGRRLDTALRLNVTPLFDLLKLTSKCGDLVANQTTIDLELAFALSKTRTDTAARLLFGKMAPHAAQTGQQVLQLRQLHLQTALTSLSMQAKNIENQRRTIDNLHRLAHGLLEIGLL